MMLPTTQPFLATIHMAIPFIWGLNWIIGADWQYYCNKRPQSRALHYSTL